ncbi:MAG: alpha/beta fold hydrolase [Gemmatimonadales bacterium]
MNRRHWLLAARTAALLIAASAGAQSAPLRPCRLPGVDVAFRCGSYSVHENRADRRSRLIPLTVIVAPARSAHPLPDPVLLVSPGGPGTTNSESLPFRAAETWMRDDRDIVIVDLRGTSGPTRLDCDMSDARGSSVQYLASFFQKDKIDACRSALARKVDLRQYTTTNIVEDFDEVRRALGYRKVNLWAASWGTRVVFLWLRMHPETIRSAILEGSAPPALLNPLPHARTAQQALDKLFAECQRQVRCHAAFPNVRGELNSILARLDTAPVTVHIPGAFPGYVVGTTLSRPQFAEALRVMTYNVPRSQRVPLLIHRAFQGDFDEFARAGVASNRGIRSSLRLGFLLAITCTEDLPRIDPATIPRETSHTYLGDSRVREQMAACDGWPRGALPSNYGDAVRSNVPVFLLSGTVDPVAGAEFSAEAAKFLPNSIHVTAPGGHVPFGPCIDSMERAFQRAASRRAVDTSCVAGMRLPVFDVAPRG